jgi:hypothetical protein
MLQWWRLRLNSEMALIYLDPHMQILECFPICHVLSTEIEHHVEKLEVHTSEGWEK